MSNIAGVSICEATILKYNINSYQENPIYLLGDGNTPSSKSDGLTLVTYCSSDIVDFFFSSLDDSSYADLSNRSTITSLTFGGFRVPVVSVWIQGCPLVFAGYIKLFNHDISKFLKLNNLFLSSELRLCIEDEYGRKLDLYLDSTVKWRYLADEKKQSLWYDEETFNRLIESVDTNKLADTILEGLFYGS